MNTGETQDSLRVPTRTTASQAVPFISTIIIVVLIARYFFRRHFSQLRLPPGPKGACFPAGLPYRCNLMGFSMCYNYAVCFVSILTYCSAGTHAQVSDTGDKLSSMLILLVFRMAHHRKPSGPRSKPPFEPHRNGREIRQCVPYTFLHRSLLRSQRL